MTLPARMETGNDPVGATIDAIRRATDRGAVAMGFEGKMISFSGSSVLVLITIGFALAGLIGAIVALPVAAISRDLFNLFLRRAQEIAGVTPPPRTDEDGDPMPAGAVPA